MPCPGRRGFTLIEMMVTVTVLGILLVLVMPGFMHARAATAKHTLRQSLIGTLVQARAVASTREQVVLLCPSHDQQSCADSEEWHHGFVAAVDVNGSGTVDPGDQPVSSHGRFDADIHAISTRGRRLLKFYPNGGNAGSNVTFTFCDRRGPTKASAMAMSNVGNYREVPASPDQVARACTGF
ncbi:MAG: GspH/FimT family pseudopilin [Ahniella sp.]|nr:GspH/FimT family pseudopilin [Ahniella sp.]